MDRKITRLFPVPHFIGYFCIVVGSPAAFKNKVQSYIGMYQIAILTGYRIVDDRIRPHTGSGHRIQKISVVLSQLCFDHLNQLVGAVNVIELPCCLLFTCNNRDKLEI